MWLQNMCQCVVHLNSSKMSKTSVGGIIVRLSRCLFIFVQKMYDRYYYGFSIQQQVYTEQLTYYWRHYITMVTASMHKKEKDGEQCIQYWQNYKIGSPPLFCANMTGEVNDSLSKGYICCIQLQRKSSTLDCTVV